MNLVERLRLSFFDSTMEEAADRIEQLEKQRDALLAAAKIILSDAPLDNGVMALATAVRECKGETK